MPGIPVAFPPGLSIQLTIGALSVSTWFSMLFCGIVITLGYMYYLEFPKDRLGFKVAVALAVTLSIIDTIAGLIWIYDWTVNLWGSIPATGIIPHGFYVNILAASLSCLLTQSFYAWRLWHVSQGNMILTGIIMTGAVMQLAVVMWVFSQWAKHPLFSQLPDVLPTAYIWIVAPIVSDLAITVSMVYYLRIKTRTAPSASRMTFNGIVSRTVQANFFSLISQVMTTILLNLDIGFYFILNDVTITKVYAFSLIVSLLARRSQSSLFTMSEKTTNRGDASANISLSNLGTTQNPRLTPGQRPPVVHVTQTVSVQQDESWEGKPHMDWPQAGQAV